MWRRTFYLFFLPAASRPDTHAGPAPNAEGPVVEVEFEPLGVGAPGPEELFGMLSGAGGPHGMTVTHSRGPDLGRLFNGLLGGMQAPRRSSRQHRGMQHLGNGDIMMLGDDSWGPVAFDEGSSMPATVFQDLFPSPFMLQDDPEEVQVMNLPDAPDLMVADMMQHINRMFKEDMMPAIHKAVQGKHPRAACQDDLQSLCNGTKWQLHCLGQHAEQISDACRKRVGKSVPFLCNKAIAHWCDGLDRGILPCLADRLEELDGSCRDAVVATHIVIAKVNTQRATLKDPQSGEEVVHVPTSPATKDLEPKPVVKPPEPDTVTSRRPVPAAKREVQLDKLFVAAPPTKAPVVTQDHTQSRSTSRPAAPAGASPASAVAVDHSAGEPASKPAPVPAGQAPLTAEVQGGRSVGGTLQAVVALGLIGACIYMLRSQVGSKSRCSTKGGALLELNTNTADHML